MCVQVACTRICRPELIDDIEAWCDPFLDVLDDIEGLLTDNRIFKQRNVDIATVKLEDAWGLGLLGRDGARFWRKMGFAQEPAPMNAMRNSSLIFQSAKMAIVMIAIWCGWKKCANL